MASDSPIPPAEGSFALDFSSELPAAQAAAQANAAAAITNVTRETQRAIRLLVRRAIREGITTREIARMVRKMVGMTAPASQAYLNLRASLLAEGLSKKAVERRLAAYAKKKIRERSETIARTEVIDSLSEGQRQSWLEAKRQGLLDEFTKREWLAVEGMCEICEGLDGEIVALDEAFSTGDDGPTAHPRCRCAVGLVDTAAQQLAARQP